MALLASQWRWSKSISRLITLSSFHPPLKLISKVIFKQDTDVILYSDITRKVVVYVREGWTKKEYGLSPNLDIWILPLCGWWSTLGWEGGELSHTCTFHFKKITKQSIKFTESPKKDINKSKKIIEKSKQIGGQLCDERVETFHISKVFIWQSF